MNDLLALVRSLLDDSRDVAQIALEDIMLKHGATDEELARETAFWRSFQEDHHERELARLAAWLGRAGQALQ